MKETAALHQEFQMLNSLEHLRFLYVHSLDCVSNARVLPAIMILMGTGSVVVV
jgi:hypothetical protein